MKRTMWSILLLAGGFAASAASEYPLAGDAENDISVLVPSGSLKMVRFHGIRPQKALSLCPEVFTPRQMENGAPAAEWKLLESGNGKVKLGTTLQERIAGVDLSGVTCIKTYEFLREIPEIRVTLHFRNDSGKRRYVFCGVRNELSLRPGAHEAVYLPAAIGTYPISSGMFLDYYSCPAPWVSSPVEGWIAHLNPGLRQGVVFLPEWDSLGMLYAAKGSTAGFTVDGGYLAPGAEFSFRYVIRPLKGLDGITTANAMFAASIRPHAGNSVRLALLPYEDGELSGTVRIVDAERKTLAQMPLKLSLRKGKIETVNLKQPVPAGHTAVLFSGTMNGRAFATEQYCENGFRMQSLPACGFAPRFLRTAPEKRRLKIISGTAERAARKRQAVCLFGLYTNFNRFERILKDWKIDTYSVTSPGMKEIPPASTLDEYSVMIVGNAFLSSLEVCMQRIRSFVKDGGILIVTGGPSAFGTGGYEKHPILKELLPLESVPFDLRPAAGKDRIDSGVAITGTGIRSGKEPYVYWMHRLVKLRPSAEVLWKAGGEPLLVKGSFGKGRVLCFLGTPLGDPKDGKTPYWDSAEYENAMRGVIERAEKEMK